MVVCPHCKSDQAHRSHRSGLLEHLASFFSYLPYRCRECGHRFLHFSFTLPSLKRTRSDSSTEREIRATRSFIERKRRRRELLLFGGGLLLFLVFLYFITRERSGSGE